jgi:maleylpyruvate isomerase
MSGKNYAGEVSMSLILHDYWRSGASYRVRIGLNLKGLAYTQVSHDLRLNAQNAPEFVNLSPQALVPTLETPKAVLTQSLAILEWLDETYPTPALLPQDPDARAMVRSMCALIACDIHPLHNLRVLKTLERDFDARQTQLDMWAQGWIIAGFKALETLVRRHGDGFSFGSQITMVECFLIPQLNSARRFKTDLSPYETLLAVESKALSLRAVQKAHPDQQPDADKPI